MDNGFDRVDTLGLFRHNYGIKDIGSILLARSKVTGAWHVGESTCWVKTTGMHKAGCYKIDDVTLIMIKNTSSE